MLKRMLNCPERITYDRLGEVCARHSAKVFAKVRLADVLPIESSGLSQRLYEFALQAHYDFVITDLAQEPLFAVEFDGPEHHTTTQIERDAKKNELSGRFGLPLLRVRADDLHRTEWQFDRLTEVTERWFDRSDSAPGSLPASRECPAIDPFSRGSNVAERPSCPLCGSDMIVKDGKYGPFLSCVRFPACMGSCDLPGPTVHSRPHAGSVHGPNESFSPRQWLIAGMVLLVLAVALIVVLIPRTRQDGPQAIELAPRVADADPATIRQMNLLGLLIRRRGWDAAERDAQIERVLEYNRRYTDLSKQEATKLITIWDDRGK